MAEKMGVSISVKPLSLKNVRMASTTPTLRGFIACAGSMRYYYKRLYVCHCWEWWRELFMRAGIRTISVVFGLAVGAITAVVIIGRYGFEAKKEAGPVSQPKAVVVEGGGSWPMFRGAQRLLAG